MKKENLSNFLLKDSLTGLYGEDYFRQVYGNYLKNNADAKLISIDLTKFKFINDNFGHDAGNDCLKLFAAIINQLFSDDGICIRLHGDEFLILTTNSNKIIEKKFNLIEKMILKEFNNVDSGEICIFFGFNAGIVKATHDLNDTLDKADITMEYGAKKMGKQFAYFSEEVYQAAKDDGYFVNKFNSIINNDEITYVYQGVYNFDGNPIGMNDIYSRIILDDCQKELVSPFNGKKLQLLEGSYSLNKLDFYNVFNLLTIETHKNNLIINIHWQTLLSHGNYSFNQFLEETILNNNVDPKKFTFCINIRTIGNEWRNILTEIETLRSWGFKIILGGYSLDVPAVGLFADASKIDFVKFDRSLWLMSSIDEKKKRIIKSITSMFVDNGTIPIFMRVENNKEIELLHDINEQSLNVGYLHGHERKLKKHQ